MIQELLKIVTEMFTVKKKAGPPIKPSPLSEEEKMPLDEWREEAYAELANIPNNDILDPYEPPVEAAKYNTSNQDEKSSKMTVVRVNKSAPTKSYRFSKASRMKLATCDKQLQRLFNEVIKEMDCTVLCGHRGEAEQNEAFDKGFSKLKYPLSKHNTSPSEAVDVAPYPLDWNDIQRFRELAAIVKRKAVELGLEVEHGGDWKSFKDWPHWELKK